MSKTILGLDLGSNSLGWALLDADEDGKPVSIKDAGVRIFPKALKDKPSVPKNQQRRQCRLARRTIQRRARRKTQLLNYLLRLNLLPKVLLEETRTEGILNGLGDPYRLRAKALDEELTPYELGRVLLHLVQRRGFLSNRKTLLGRDMLDDPDVIAVLEEEGEKEGGDTEESAFKADINMLRKEITEASCRTLGEFLALKPQHACKRNRHGMHLRTDRQMYQEELALIFKKQIPFHSILTEETREQVEHIIFHQRPLKLKKDRIGKCSLEPYKKRTAIARLEYQRFRYMQDINNLQYFDPYTDRWKRLNDEERKSLLVLFERSSTVTFRKIRETLGLDRKTEFNLENENKKLKGNTTAAAIKGILSSWDDFSNEQQYALVEDLLSIKNKSALKQRLINHWQLDHKTAVQLCLLELEPNCGKLSLKAIRRLLPHMERGLNFPAACIASGYAHEQEKLNPKDKLGPPPTLPNPIVNKGLHELKRVVNALIKEYGKPDVIRIEMARDLEMNTKRYKNFIAQQKKNTQANEDALNAYQDEARKNPGMGLSKYPSRDQKIRYRLWVDQKYCCAYSCQPISRGALFSADVEVDHIIPYSQSLDDSYMNKVVCFAKENQNKGQQTPIDAFGGNEEKWNQISHAINAWGNAFSSKRERFYLRYDDLNSDFISSQLNDTRYIAKEAGAYLKTLGVDITFTRGVITDWLRHQWQLNDLLGTSAEKERTDHRHHAIDAVVTACIDRSLYNTLVYQAKKVEQNGVAMTMRDLYITPPIIDIKEQLKEKLSSLIVSHVPQRKITGALHEETGVGFIDGIGTVYRKHLDKNFTSKKIDSIIDEQVRALVASHLKKFGGDSKSAFAQGFKLFHKDGKTPIKRVRVVQSETSLEKLKKSKFPIRNSEGSAFKWYAYGNTHHVEILRHKTKKDKYASHFVTTMDAAQRVRVKSKKQSLIKTDHGDEWEFLMALHINDLVIVEIAGKEQIHRIQKLNMVNAKVATRLHTAATVSVKTEGIELSPGALIKNYKMRPIVVNAIGKRLYD